MRMVISLCTLSRDGSLCAALDRLIPGVARTRVQYRVPSFTSSFMILPTVSKVWEKNSSSSYFAAQGEAKSGTFRGSKLTIVGLERKISTRYK